MNKMGSQKVPCGALDLTLIDIILVTFIVCILLARNLSTHVPTTGTTSGNKNKYPKIKL